MNLRGGIAFEVSHRFNKVLASYDQTQEESFIQGLDHRSYIYIYIHIRIYKCIYIYVYIYIYGQTILLF